MVNTTTLAEAVSRFLGIFEFVANLAAFNEEVTEEDHLEEAIYLLEGEPEEHDREGDYCYTCNAATCELTPPKAAPVRVVRDLAVAPTKTPEFGTNEVPAGLREIIWREILKLAAKPFLVYRTNLKGKRTSHLSEDVDGLRTLCGRSDKITESDVMRLDGDYECDCTNCERIATKMLRAAALKARKNFDIEQAEQEHEDDRVWLDAGTGDLTDAEIAYSELMWDRKQIDTALAAKARLDRKERNNEVRKEN